MSKPEGFDVNRSQVAPSALANFLADELVEDITSVPGIGPAAAKALAEPREGEPGVKSTYQLIGKYLSLREPGMSSQAHLDAFWFWLQVKGVAAHRAGIVHCVAEKVALLVPGAYKEE